MIIQEIQPRKPYPTKKALKRFCKIESTVPKAKTTKPEDLIDDTLLKKIDQSGFIDSLYR